MFVMDILFYVFTAVLFELNHVSATIKRINCSPGQQCILLISCPEVRAFFNKEGGVARVQSLICAFEGHRSKVCCDVSREETTPADETPRIDVIPVSISVTPGRIVTPGDVSVTPSTIVTPVTRAVTPETSLQSNLLPKHCGFIGERIVDGEELPLRSYMWLALLEIDGTGERPSWGCGGSLISERYVVTAAHCGVSRTITRVRLGEHDISKIRDCEQLLTGPLCAPPVQDFIIRPEDIIVHPDYNKRVDRGDDIALIRLNRPAQLNRYVKPICLPPSTLDINQFLKGRKAEVAGWGRTDSRDFTKTSDVKLMVELPFVDLKTCKDVFVDLKTSKDVLLSPLLDKGQICFGGEEGKDSCSGDSGGPLVSTDTNVDSTNLYVLLGVVSYGSFFCGENITRGGYTGVLPGVYTEVSHYRNWIVSNLKP